MRACGHFIEQQGLLVQQYAQESLTFIKQISTCAFSSIQLCGPAVTTRSKAALLSIHAGYYLYTNDRGKVPGG